MNAATRIRTEWHPAMTTRMCELIGDGKSFAEVGQIMGFTRNALIGRFNRLIIEADRKFLTRDALARFLERGLEVEDIASDLIIPVGAVEARLAEIRRALGPQAR